MIIESLCYFPPTKRKRAAKAEQAVRDVLGEFRSELRWLTVSAFVMQATPFAIPFAVYYWLPSLLDATASSALHRMTSLCTLVGIFSGTVVIRVGASYFFLRNAGRVGNLATAKMRRAAYQHLMRLPVSYVEKRGTGKVLLRFMGDSDAFRNWFSKTGPKLIADIACLLVIAVGLMYFSWQLALLLAVPLTAFVCSIAFFSARVRQQTRQARRQQASLSGIVEHRLANIRRSKVADAHASDVVGVETLFDRVAGLNAHRDGTAAALEASGQLSAFSAVPLILLVGFPLVWRNGLNADDFLAFIWLTLHFVVTLRVSLAAIVIHQKALISVQRLYALLARSAEAGRSAQKIAPRFSSLSLVHNGNCLTFKAGIHQLPHEIDIDLMYSLLLGYEQRKAFEVKLDGVPIRRVGVNARRRRIGIVPITANLSADCLDAVSQLRIVLLAANGSLTGGVLKTISSKLNRRAIVFYQGLSEGMSPPSGAGELQIPIEETENLHFIARLS